MLVIDDLAGRTLQAWPRRQVRGAAAPARDGVATLQCPGCAGRLLVGDPALLRALRQPSRDLMLGLLAGVLLAVGVAAIAVGVPVLSLAARFVPNSWQDRLGDAAIRDGFAHPRWCNRAAGQAALDRLTARLAAAGGISGHVSVNVLDSPQVNAFALPARSIVVMRGLIGRMQDGGELAGVLGHELGHVIHRDPLVGYLRTNLVAATAELTGLGGAAPAGNVLMLSYSRAAETRADATSLRLMHDAGMRSDGLGRALARLDGPDLGWLSDHPLTPARIAASAGSSVGDPPLSDAEWAAVQDMCAGR